MDKGLGAGECQTSKCASHISTGASTTPGRTEVSVSEEEPGSTSPSRSSTNLIAAMMDWTRVENIVQQYYVVQHIAAYCIMFRHIASYCINIASGCIKMSLKGGPTELLVNGTHNRQHI